MSHCDLLARQLPGDGGRVGTTFVLLGVSACVYISARHWCDAILHKRLRGHESNAVQSADPLGQAHHLILRTNAGG